MVDQELELRVSVQGPWGSSLLKRSVYCPGCLASVPEQIFREGRSWAAFVTLLHLSGQGAGRALGCRARGERFFGRYQNACFSTGVARMCRLRTGCIVRRAQEDVKEADYLLAWELVTSRSKHPPKSLRVAILNVLAGLAWLLL
jgi:hypothetical protein